MATNPDRIAAALKATYPQLPPAQCEALAGQLTTIIDRATSMGVETFQLRAQGTRTTSLSRTLKELREAAGLSQNAVTKAADWSISKLSRIESGAVGISTVDLKFLLRLYGITDPARVEYLCRLAKS